MIGLFDVERIFATLLDEPTGINAALLSESEYDPAELDDVCRVEIQAMASVMPRIVAGYTELSESRLTSRLILELREDIAAGVSAFAGPVPGLGQPQGGLFSFGMGFDLLAIREFYSAQLEALEASPYECEFFADMQAGVASGRELLNQPVPPIAYGFKGFMAVVDDVVGMDLANDIPPTSVDMRMLVSTDNAEGLLAMGAMFSPDVAALNLQVGGEPVILDMPQLQATGQTVYVAMSDNALAFSSGEGMQDGLLDMLSAPVANPSPFMSTDIDADRYYEFIQSSMAANADDDLAENPAMKDALEALMTAPREIFSRFRVDVEFTQNGVEVVSDAALND